MSYQVDKRLLSTIVLAAIIIGGIFLFFIYGIPYLYSLAVGPPAVEYKYTTDLTVYFKVFDDTAKTTLTSNIQPSFYAAGENPFARVYTGTPISVASYDSVEGEWAAVLDAGTYELLVTDTATSKTKYPELVTVTVPGTNDEDMEVKLSPYMIHMVQRATPSLSTSILAYNASSGAYDITVTNINGTSYDKWRVHLQITVAGLDKKLKAGRIYFSKITNLAITAVYYDGELTPVLEDTDSSDDGLTGYYIEFPDMLGGEIHDVYIYLEETGTLSSATLTITLADYYACQATAIKWWSYSTTSISVVT